MDSTPRKDGAFARWDSLSPASIPDILLSPPSHDLAVSLPASGSSRQRHVLLEDVTLRGDSSGSCPVAGFREAPSDRGSSECIRGVQERKGSSRGNVAGFTAQRTSTPAPSDAAGIAEGPGAGAGPPVPVPIPRLPPTAPSAGHHVSSLSSRCPKGVLHAERENLAPKSMQGMGMTCSRDINSGSGYLDDADSILERLAEKAKHAVAVAAAVDTGSGGSIQVPAPAPRTTVTEAATITTAPSPSFPGTSANEDIVDRRDEPDESVVAGGRRSGGARLAELCQEDKSKIARLMQDLIKLRAEKEGYNGRLARLRAQNESIVQEISALRAKFGQSVQLLRKYQSMVRGAEIAGGGSAGHGPSPGPPETLGAPVLPPVPGPPPGPARTNDASDVEALRIALRAAEEKADRVAEEERVRREALAAELCSLRAEAQALREQARNQGMSSPRSLSPRTLSPRTRASAGLSTAVVMSASAGVSSGHRVVAPGFDGIATAPKTPGVPVSVGAAELVPPNPAGRATNIAISVSGLSPSGGRAAVDGQGHVVVREARPDLPVESTSAPPRPLFSESGPGIDGDRVRSPPGAMVASVTPLPSVVPDERVSQLPSVSLTSAEPTASSQSSAASVSAVPSTATTPSVSAGSSVALQSRMVKQGVGESAARKREGIPGGSAIQEDDTRGAMSVAPEMLLSLQRQVEVLKQELAMVNVRQQLSVTGAPAGDARYRGVQTGSDDRGSGLEVHDEPYPSRGYPVQEAGVHQDREGGGRDAVEEISPPIVDLGGESRGRSWGSEQRASDDASERVDDRDGEIRPRRGIGTDSSTPPTRVLDADAVHGLGGERGRRRGRRIERREHEVRAGLHEAGGARAGISGAGGSVRSFSELSLPGAGVRDRYDIGVEFSDPSRTTGSILHVDADEGPVADGGNTHHDRSSRVRTRFGFEGSPVRELPQDVTALSPSYGHRGKGVEPPRRPHTWFEADSPRESTDNAASTGNDEASSTGLRGILSEKALGSGDPEWMKNRRRQDNVNGGASKLRVSWGSSVSESLSSRSDGGVSLISGKNEKVYLEDNSYPEKKVYLEGGGRSVDERRRGWPLEQRDHGGNRADLEDAKGRSRSALNVGMPTNGRRTVGVESRTGGMPRRGPRGMMTSGELDRRSRAGHPSRFSEGPAEVGSRSVPRLPQPLAPRRRNTTGMSGDSSGSGSDYSVDLCGEGRRESHVGGRDGGDPHIGRSIACSSVSRPQTFRRRGRRGESCGDEGHDARFSRGRDDAGIPKAHPGRDTGSFFDSTLLDLIDDLEGNEEHLHAGRPGVHDKENVGYGRGILRTAPTNPRRHRDRWDVFGGSV